MAGLDAIVQSTFPPLPTDWEDDMRRELSVIATRPEALSRFIGAYARLAKLLHPQLDGTLGGGASSPRISCAARR
ncbi:MAG TPA: hypothetical protein VN924_01860 [Bryobacteraceae bacterium]|nr:hypothetical protein [Bryobacteraceae bacterium]